jgi:hypothetical protein
VPAADALDEAVEEPEAVGQPRRQRAPARLEAMQRRLVSTLRPGDGQHLLRIAEHLEGGAAVAGQDRRAHGARLGEHQPKRFRDHEIRTEGTECRARLSQHARVRQ